MAERHAKHCVLGLSIDGREILAAGSDVYYFNSDQEFVEWCDLQEVIHDSRRIFVYAVHAI